MLSNIIDALWQRKVPFQKKTVKKRSFANFKHFEPKMHFSEIEARRKRITTNVFAVKNNRINIQIVVKLLIFHWFCQKQMF
jgi:hypothetical protein